MSDAPLDDRVRDLLLALGPGCDALLCWLRPRVDDAMLLEIAGADYGMDADAHLAALRRIRDEGLFAVQIGWEPKEVLELIRWSEPENPAWKTGSTGDAAGDRLAR
ncbi:MAG: hypothetical protein RLZZ387_4202 [Chloroflexota bacterium]|jgi:hypothetical protein